MSYPNDAGTTYTTKVDGTDVIYAADVNNLQTEISAIKTLLGIIGSAVTGTFYYVMSEITGSDKVLGKTATQTTTNKTLSTGTKVLVGSDATGDIYYNGGSGVLTRLAASTNGFILKLVAGIPAWVAETVVVAATEAVEGISRLATAAQITAGTASEGGYPIVITPDQLALSAPTFSAANVTNLPLNIYTTSSSANQKLAADNTTATISAGTAKVKEIIVNYSGVISSYFEAQGNGVGTTWGQVYKNDVAIGTQRNPLTNGSYTAYTEDVTVSSGDRIQLYLNGSGGGQSTAKNFRIRYDKAISNEGLIVTN